MDSERLIYLIEKAQNGAIEVIGELYEAFGREISQLVKIWAYSVRAEIREEIEQEIWLRAILSIGQIKNAAKFRAWLKTLAFTKTMDILRKMSRDPVMLLDRLIQDDEYELNIYDILDSVDLSMPASEYVEVKEFLTHLIQATRHLVTKNKITTRHVTVFIRNLEGWMNKETATSIGIPNSYVGKLLCQAKKRIGEYMSAEYGYSSQEVDERFNTVLEKMPEILAQLIDT